MADSPDPTRDAEPSEGPEERRVERFIRPYFTDSTLWPVLFVLVGALSTLGASVLLLAVEGRNVFALAALAILLLGSADAVFHDLRRRRIGLAAGAVLGLWALSGAIAFAAVHWGLY